MYSSQSLSPEMVVTSFEDNQASILWVPDNDINGLDNPNPNSTISAINSFIQLFGNVCGISSELPIDHIDQLVRSFTRCLLALHLGRLHSIKSSVAQLAKSPNVMAPHEAISTFRNRVNLLERWLVIDDKVWIIHGLLRVFLQDILLKTRLVPKTTYNHLDQFT